MYILHSFFSVRKMKNTLKILSFAFSLLFMLQDSYGQSDTIAKQVLVVDDIQIDVKQVLFDSITNITTVELFLTSYTKNERELKLNTYATQLIDAKGEKNYFATISLDQILIKIEDKQNYLNYLMLMDEPVLLKVSVANWTKDKGRVQTLLLAFEDSQEEGHYIETAIQL